MKLPSFETRVYYRKAQEHSDLAIEFLTLSKELTLLGEEKAAAHVLVKAEEQWFKARSLFQKVVFVDTSKIVFKDSDNESK